jgi:hypothetical protein
VPKSSRTITSIMTSSVIPRDIAISFLLVFVC